MAESVDALVSNTSGATRAGSTPALGTQETGEQIFLFACFFFCNGVGRAPVRIRMSMECRAGARSAYTIGKEWPLIFL